MSDKWLIYGANGYTAGLVIDVATRRGLRPILAGRRAEAILPLAEKHGLEHRIFSLDDPAKTHDALIDVAAVAHLAGPYVHTSQAMVDACLATGTNYLDITGEFVVFESIFRLDEEARQNNVSLIPGVGFDVVSTDCLAKMLADALPDAVELELAFTAFGGKGTSISRGTLKTMIEFMTAGSVVRRDGKLEPVPAAWRTPRIAFPSGGRATVTIPWGDISTAYRSTGIPNIAVYTTAPARAYRVVEFLAPVFKPRFVRRALQHLVQATVVGPDAEARAATHSEVWGRVTNAAGKSVTATYRGPEAYSLTADAVVRAVQHVLAGNAPAGALTPSLAFGKDFLLELDGVSAPEFTPAV
ncbi:MAG: saccharopine dehydrogenase NADP-binding domain-containing protein [Candidatus Lernaella stagnicola]|nr:saccharopine dehydrogenase NADP-binding domain-containing protein [Candidatus Lernaella stagnicola]